jgi:hypothetical protein
MARTLVTRGPTLAAPAARAIEQCPRSVVRRHTLARPVPADARDARTGALPLGPRHRAVLAVVRERSSLRERDTHL